ncbi:hypothetical protein ACHAWF_008335 [Thalassiosira exigua]
MITADHRPTPTMTVTPTAAPPPPPSPFHALPRNVATLSILPYAESRDWLNFRAASRGCYDVVHGDAAHRDVSFASCPTCEGRRRPGDGGGDGGGGGIPVDGDPSLGDGEGEELWRLALVRDYGFGDDDEDGDRDRVLRCIHSPVDRRGDAFLSATDEFVAPNSFAAWKHWRKVDLRLHFLSREEMRIPSGERVVGPYFLRAAAMWRKIERWCRDEGRSGALGREILSSLAPGRPIDPPVPVPRAQTSALKAVYAFYAGQRDPMMDAPAAGPQRFDPCTSLFGGYQVYDVSCLALLKDIGALGSKLLLWDGIVDLQPIGSLVSISHSQVVACTRFLEPEESFQYDSRPFISIAQCDHMKLFTMDFVTGQIYFITGGAQRRRLVVARKPGQSTPTTPTRGPVLEDVGEEEIVFSRDSLLRWFEEHARRLDENLYSVGNLVPNFPGPSRLSILRYPAPADEVNCSRAVTRGVEVVASAVLAPEIGMFVYSIRIRLLAPDDGDEYMTPEQRGFDTCQLAGRHWRISKDGLDGVIAPRVEDVRGEGLIGYHPLLEEGRYYCNVEGGGSPHQLSGPTLGPFCYQSCTENHPGSLEGSLQFRPGSLMEPSGEAFDVRVAPFPMTSTSFLY